MSVRKRKWQTSKGEIREAWIVDYVDPQGKRCLQTFDRKKDADAYHATVKVDIAKGVHVAPSRSPTVTEAGERWLQASTDAGLGRATIKTYTEHVRLHIGPFFGRMKLSQITVGAIRDFQDKLREAGRSPDMVKRCTKTLGSIIADAQERGLVAQNVVRSLRRTRRTKAAQTEKLKVGVDIPTPAEISAIIAASEGRWRPFLLVAAFAGLRASELRGLMWADIDLKRGELHVRQRADRFNAIDKPKSAAGERTVPIGPVVVNALKQWRLACPRGELGLVFPTGAGNVESHSNVVQRGFGPTQIRGGVVNADGGPKYGGLHALRHFYASWCINRRGDGGLELPLKTVQARLGHATITMTGDRYGHLFPRTDDGAELADAERALLSLHAT